MAMEIESEVWLNAKNTIQPILDSIIPHPPDRVSNLNSLLVEKCLCEDRCIVHRSHNNKTAESSKAHRDSKDKSAEKERAPIFCATLDAIVNNGDAKTKLPLPICPHDESTHYSFNKGNQKQTSPEEIKEANKKIQKPLFNIGNYCYNAIPKVYIERKQQDFKAKTASNVFACRECVRIQDDKEFEEESDNTIKNLVLVAKVSYNKGSTKSSKKNQKKSKNGDAGDSTDWSITYYLVPGRNFVCGNDGTGDHQHKRRECDNLQLLTYTRYDDYANMSYEEVELKNILFPTAKIVLAENAAPDKSPLKFMYWATRSTETIKELDESDDEVAKLAALKFEPIVVHPIISKDGSLQWPSRGLVNYVTNPNIKKVSSKKSFDISSVLASGFDRGIQSFYENGAFSEKYMSSYMKNHLSSACRAGLFDDLNESEDMPIMVIRKTARNQLIKSIEAVALLDRENPGIRGVNGSLLEGCLFTIPLSDWRLDNSTGAFENVWMKAISYNTNKKKISPKKKASQKPPRKDTKSDDQIVKPSKKSGNTQTKKTTKTKTNTKTTPVKKVPEKSVEGDMEIEGGEDEEEDVDEVFVVTERKNKQKKPDSEPVKKTQKRKRVDQEGDDKIDDDSKLGGSELKKLRKTVETLQMTSAKRDSEIGEIKSLLQQLVSKTSSEDTVHKVRDKVTDKLQCVVPGTTPIECILSGFESLLDVKLSSLSIEVPAPTFDPAVFSTYTDGLVEIKNALDNIQNNDVETVASNQLRGKISDMMDEWKVKSNELLTKADELIVTASESFSNSSKFDLILEKILQASEKSSSDTSSMLEAYKDQKQEDKAALTRDIARVLEIVSKTASSIDLIASHTQKSSQPSGETSSHLLEAVKKSDAKSASILETVQSNAKALLELQSNADIIQKSVDNICKKEDVDKIDEKLVTTIAAFYKIYQSLINNNGDDDDEDDDEENQ